MPIYPHAVWEDVGAPANYSNGTMHSHTGVVLHVNDAQSLDLYGWITGNHDMSCHFQVTKDGTCLVPEHRVLTADLRWVPGGDVQVGDRLVAFDEHGSALRSGRCYREAVVEWIEPADAEVYAVVLDDEVTIYTTAEHRWLAQTNESWSWHKTVNDAGRSIVGATIPRLIRPWNQRTDYEAGWFAGFLDGEGHLTKRHRIAVAQRPTVVLDRAHDYMKEQGYEFTEAVTGGGRGDCRKFDILGPLATRLELLGSHRPSRLLASVNIAAFGSLRANHADLRKVVAVYPVGVRSIVKMQTSTGTFIAEGFGMHNCYQYIDTRYSSWCQKDGNDDYLSIESQGLASEPATDAQIAAIGGILAWCKTVHGIPLQLAEVPGQRGFGWHGMGAAHGFDWGHPLCPGVRKDQRTAMLAAAGGTQPPEDDMTPEEHDLLVSIANAVKLDTAHPGVPSLGEVWRLAQADNTDTAHAWTNASIRKALDALADESQSGITSVLAAINNLTLTLSPDDITAIAAAVLAGMPGGGSAPTLEQITQAFATVVNTTRLATP